MLGTISIVFKITSTVLIAHTVEPSIVFLTHTFDPSTVLGKKILRYTVDSITLLYHTLWSRALGPNCKAGTYVLHIGTVKLPNFDVSCTN